MNAHQDLPRGVVLGALALACAGAAAAPDAADDGAAVSSGAAPLQIGLHATAIGTSQRKSAELDIPAPAERDREARLRVTGRGSWALSPALHATLSGSLTNQLVHTPGRPTERRMGTDLREGFLSWQIGQTSYLEAGRIIERNGVAFGSSPSDPMRALAADTNSLDGTETRDARHGVYMVRYTHITEQGSFALLHAPRLRRPDASLIATIDKGIGSMQTNWHPRTLLKVSVNLNEDVSPDLVAYHDSLGTSLAASLVVGSGGATTWYAEGGVSDRRPLGDEALRLGRQIGYLPAGTSTWTPEGAAPRYAADASLGFVHTLDSRLTLNLEYGWSGRAFDRDQWRRWFDSGQAARSAAELAPLWFMRSYASAMQEPISRQYLLARFELKNAFGVDRLGAAGHVYAALAPYSTTWQASLRYAGIPSSVLSASVFDRTGGRRTEFGSTHKDAGLLLRLERYF